MAGLSRPSAAASPRSRPAGGRVAARAWRSWI